jgi:hypothetical protein
MDPGLFDPSQDDITSSQSYVDILLNLHPRKPVKPPVRLKSRHNLCRRRLRFRDALRLTPYALRLTPYALRLTPYALRLTPYALRLTPSSCRRSLL